VKTYNNKSIGKHPTLQINTLQIYMKSSIKTHNFLLSMSIKVKYICFQMRRCKFEHNIAIAELVCIPKRPSYMISQKFCQTKQLRDNTLNNMYI